MIFNLLMIRNIIIGLTIFCFTLSGIVIYRTLRLPTNNTDNHKINQGIESQELLTKTQELSRNAIQPQADTQPSEQALNAASSEVKTKISEKKQKQPVTIESKDTSGEVNVIAIYGDGIFRTGQFAVSDELEQAIQKVVPDIKGSPDFRVIVEGHTDNIRPSQSTDKRYMDNMELSFLRAKAVAFIFVKNGIPLERISVVGYGDTRPVADNETNEGRAKNRRVEVKLIAREKEF